MTNRLLGMFAASLLMMSACGEQSDGADEGADALASEFQSAQRRGSAGDGGVGNGQGRGNCGRGGERRIGRGNGKGGGAEVAESEDVDVDADEATEEAASDRGAGRVDVDVDTDEAAEEATSGESGAGGARKGNGRCGDQPAARDGGVQPQRDAGARPPVARDAGGPQVIGGSQRDAGRGPVGAPVGAGAETVTLPDGTSVRVDPSCPSLTRSGITLPGCCLPANSCGLSTHLIDVTGVPKGCQDYAQARAVDPTFDLQAKACTFRN